MTYHIRYTSNAHHPMAEGAEMRRNMEPLLLSYEVDSLPLTSYLLSRTSYLLPLTSYLLHLTSYLLPLTSYLLPLTSYLLPLTS